MRLENQVCSLDLSKRLRELGVKQESLFYFSEGTIQRFGMIAERFEDLDKDDVSAFTVAELGEMLPHIIHTPSSDGYREQLVTTYKRKSDYLASAGLFYEVLADTEANARAKMLIHLIEQGIFKP